MAQESMTLEEKLAAAEQRTGLPAGVLRSVIQQETGGKQDYIADPSKYHYAANAEGKRIAGHTGQISTAFGPFGILESTGAKPGFGVSPLASKDLDEQIRFASDYLSARIRAAGSVSAGLAGYGEGDAYASRVLGRIGQAPVPPVAPAITAPARPEGWPTLPTARQPREIPSTAPQEALVNLAAGQVAFLNAQTGEGATNQAVAQAEAQQAERDSVGFGDVFGEARRDARLQPMFSAMDYIHADTEVKPEGWTYAAQRDTVEAGLSDDDREYLRENGSAGPQALIKAQAQLAYRKDLDRTYGLAGGFTAFAGQMAGGAMDPVGFALGLGAGKALGMLGVGSRALAVAGRPGAAAASFIGENALANVSVEAMQDALGEVKTSSDYAMAAATGAMMAAPFTRGAIRTDVSAAAHQLAQDINASATKEQAVKVADHIAATGETDPVRAARAVEAKELDDIMATVDENASPKVMDQVVPQDLAAEQRRILEGVEEAPARAEPTAKQPEQLPQMQPKPVPETVQEVRAGELSRSLETPGGTVELKFRLRPEEAKAPGKNTYSVRDLLSEINRAGEGADPTSLRSAQYFLKVLSKDVLDVPVHLSLKRRGGEFDPNTAEIKSVGGDGNTAAHAIAGMGEYGQSVLIHEVGHAATHSKIQAYLDAPTKVSPQIAKAGKQLDDLLSRYRAAVLERFPPEAREYGTGTRKAFEEHEAYYAANDLHEFAAQVWSSEPARDILKSMPGKPVAGMPSSAWREMLGILSKMLGLSRKDGLTEATRVLDMLLHADGSGIKYKGGQQALFAPGPPPIARAAFQQRYAESLWQHARNWMAANPIRTERLNVLTQKIGGVSDGLILAGSRNPIMQMVASLVTETTTGAAGRKANVAIRSRTEHAKLIGNAMLDYEGAYSVWAKDNNVRFGDSVFTGRAKREFHNHVYYEILNRRDATYTPHPDLSVVRAADSLEGALQRAADSQRAADTLGSDALAPSSRGYIPQALDGNKLQTLSVQDLHAVHQNLSAQFQAREGWDKAFADLFAPHYTDRIRKRAQGSKGIDGLAAGGDGAQVVRDTLEDMALDPTLRDRSLAAAATIGSKYTKRRLDLDLRQEVRPGMRLGDIYVTDPLALTRSYTRHTAGVVALTEAGIHGTRGVRQLREAAGTVVQGSDGQMPSLREFEAYDRVMAEILGTPVAGQVISAGATNMGLTVSLQRLGSLVFTQAAETFQLVNHLGLGSLMGGVSSLPRMLGEVSRLRKGQRANNPLLDSIEVLGGELGTDHYKLIAPLDAPDARLEQYMEQSGVFTRLLRAGGHVQSQVSGFRGLLAAQHRAAAEQITLKAMRYIREGKDSVALADMGFTPEVVAAIRGDLGQIATWTPGGKLASLDLSLVSDPRIAEAFVQAVHRGTGQIIQGTFIGEHGKWFHNDYLRLMLQLRTFGLTATEKQWGRQRMNHNYAYAAGMLLGQMAMSLPVHLARVQLAAAGREDREKYIKDQLNPAQLTKSLMNYASMSGLTGDVLGLTLSIAGGWGDKGTKDTLGVRNTATGVGKLIPAAGTIDQAYKVASGKTDLHTALKQLPFSNLWYLVPLVNMTKD